MNKKIKIIELLLKIAHGEYPKRFKYNNKIYEYKRIVNGTGYVTENDDWFNSDIFIDDWDNLNEYVEIIEDKEDINIQGICGLPEWGYDDDDIRRTINKLVQAIKQLDKTKEEK